MAAGLNLPKYTGAESPVIWISKLEAWQAFHNYTDQRMMSITVCPGWECQYLVPDSTTSMCLPRQFQNSTERTFSARNIWHATNGNQTGT